MDADTWSYLWRQRSPTPSSSRIELERRCCYRRLVMDSSYHAHRKRVLWTVITKRNSHGTPYQDPQRKMSPPCTSVLVHIRDEVERSSWHWLQMEFGGNDPQNPINSSYFSPWMLTTVTCDLLHPLVRHIMIVPTKLRDISPRWIYLFNGLLIHAQGLEFLHRAGCARSWVC